LGFDRNLTHLDGHVVRLVREGVTQPGQFLWSTLRLKTEKPGPGFVQTIEGEGMPLFERSGHGDLFIEYNVVLPTTLTPQTRRSEYCLTIGFLLRRYSLSFAPTELAEAFHSTKQHPNDEL
jgi:DnaJ-class molecular chaperone